MKLKNKEVIQSYLLTSAKYNFSVHEKRVLYRLVEICQAALDGKKLDTNFSISETLFEEEKNVSIPISAFVPEGDTNYNKAKEALRSLRAKEIELDTKEEWKLFGIIEQPRIEKGTGIATFRITKDIWDAIQTFSKGWKKFELKTTFEFDSVYAMRFYELFSNQKKPITFTIDQIKIMFGIEGKYSRGNDFIKRVITPAQQELDKKSPWSFKYESIKVGRKLHSIKFIPYFIYEKEDKDLAVSRLKKKQSISWDIPYNIAQYLKDNFLFTDKELKNNVSLFKDADEKLDILNFIADLRQKAENASNPKGYLINALKKKLSSM